MFCTTGWFGRAFLSTGSISVELATGDALVGDLLASGILLGGIIRTGHAKRPPFEDDPGRVADQLLRLTDAGFDRFYVGHGGPIAGSEVARHAHALRSLSAIEPQSSSVIVR